MWIARVTIKYEDKVHKIEIRRSTAKELLSTVGRITEEIIEVHIYQGVEV